MSIVSRAAALIRPDSARSIIGPIGIDFGLEAVHLVQLEAATGKNPQVRARVSLPYESRGRVLESPHQFRSLMKRALDSDRFSGRKAVIAMPSGMFRTVSINYQSGPGKEQESAAILKVMRNRLDGDLADYVLDYLPVKSRTKKDERLALVAVSERQPVVEFLDLARKARLDVLALEIGPVAITRLVSALSQESGADNVLVINSGRAASYLTLISGDDLLFDLEVSFGEDCLIRQAASTLDMSEDMARDLLLRSGIHAGGVDDTVQVALEEAGLVSTMSEILKPQFLKLVDEIKRVCLYAAAETRGGSVTQVYLLGSIARWPGSDHLLSSLTGSEVAKIPDPLALFPGTAKKGSNRSKSAPEIVVATGAALRGMRSHG